MLNSKKDNLEYGFLKPEYPFKYFLCQQLIDMTHVYLAMFVFAAMFPNGFIPHMNRVFFIFTLPQLNKQYL